MFYVQLIVTILGVSIILAFITASILLGMQSLIIKNISLTLRSQHQKCGPTAYGDNQVHD